MISAVRRCLETWYVRAFFAIMVLSFVFWGVGDVVRMVGATTWVAKIGDTTIEGAAMQAEFQRALSTAARDLPAGQEATAELRRQIGEETLRRAITDAALSAELRVLRVVAPDTLVAEQARGMAAFRGPDGKFSKSAFEIALRNNGLNEDRFLGLLRGDLARKQLLGAVGAGASTPDTLLNPLFAHEYQKRSARVATFVIATVPDPGEPDPATLQRWYDNHPDRYMSPEYRRIRAVTLTPQRLAQDILVTDAELSDAYDRTRAQYVTEARRSAQVISVADETGARTLADTWRGGADWTAMQAAATAAGASAVALDDSTATQFPDPDLSKAVFAATPDTVLDPVKGLLGWYVIKVTHAVAGTEPTLDQVKDKVRERVVTDRAADLMYEHANKVDNLLANGTSLEEMPGDLGLVGVSGTLDAQGMTLENEVAPIVGATELRTALLAAAFQTQPGDPARLVEVATPSLGGSSYYVLTVEDITPPALKPLDIVKDHAIADWKADQQRHTREIQAAAMLKAVRDGQSMADAATVAGVTEHATPLVTRGQTTEDVPPELQAVLFSLKSGEATMVEVPEGFIVATLAQVVDPDITADAAAHTQARNTIARSITADIGTGFTDALRLRANPRINQKNLDQIVQP